MRSLSRADAIRLEAAEGWLELGNAAEADQELAQISTKFHTHPDVLELRWKIYAHAKRWEDSLAIAETLTDSVPRHSNGWLLLASSLHHLGKTEDACQTLLEVFDEFPGNGAFPYQLACYFSQMEQFQEAKEWLETAFDVGNPKELKAAALTEPALVGLWKSLRKESWES